LSRERKKAIGFGASRKLSLSDEINLAVKGEGEQACRRLRSQKKRKPTFKWAKKEESR